MEDFESQAPTWRAIYAFVDTLAVSAAVDLGIPDILHAAGSNASLSLPAIAAQISPHPAGDLTPLRRLMRFLTRKRFFNQTLNPQTGDLLYSLAPSSKYLLKSSKSNLSPLFPLVTLSFFKNSPGSYLAECVRTGESPFRLAHGGKDQWSVLSEDRVFGDAFNAGMACLAEIDVSAMVDAYESGFAGLRSITDVGGGNGAALGEIVRRFPSVRGISFDLPHVVAGATEWDGVVHVGGDMFVDDIPPADAVLMKWILHCFEDDDCIKILRKCLKAIPKENGKIILIEKILSDDDGIIGDITAAMDIVMLATTGGKERTEEEWAKLFEVAGFVRYNIIKIPATSSIIELYPKQGRSLM